MSYTGTGQFEYASAEQGIQDLAVSPDSTDAAQVAQLQAAKDAAVALVKSGTVVADDAHDVSVSINGHTDATTGANSVGVYLSAITKQTAPA